MSTPKNRFLAVILMIVIGLAVPTQAQESAINQATATVLSALTILGNNDLVFGSVTPGIDKSVDKATVGFAAEWEILGAPGAELAINFSLPTDLLLIDSTVTMPVVFNNTDASFEDGTGAGQTAPAGLLNPLGPAAERLGVGGTLFIWLGGTVQPGLTQTGGAYAADVILTVAYTGS